MIITREHDLCSKLVGGGSDLGAIGRDHATIDDLHARHALPHADDEGNSSQQP
jgi:hypothetical protein